MFFGPVLTVLAVVASFISASVVVSYEPTNCWEDDGSTMCEYDPPHY